ncbi:hypothetical protein ACH5RR_001453 [Cinchona calisaya]|uniref:Uncharacterized protein n=1 Tax=Cinchona calisaya TaxID=153742 RepID=A0ABD3B3F2_9GENT
MEYENKTSHSSPATCTTPEPNSDSGDDSHPVHPATGNDGDDLKEENPETVRETKKRKICPSSLEKCEAIIKKSCSNSSNCFSFSFDPKYSSGASTPQVTPKFGSFNLVAAAASSAEIEGKSVEEKEEEKNDEVEEKKKIIEEVLGSVNGLGAD